MLGSLPKRAACCSERLRARMLRRVHVQLALALALLSAPALGARPHDDDESGLGLHDVHMVQASLDHFERAVSSAKSRLSPEAHDATMHGVSRLQTLCRDITGQDADAAMEERRKEKRAAVKKSGTVLGQLQSELGLQWTDWKERVFGSESYTFTKKKEEVKQAATAALPGEFAEFRQWVLTHPELKEHVLGDETQRMPKWLDSSDFAPRRS